MGQEIYDIAEWLAHNRDSIGTGSKQMIIRKVLEHFEHLSLEQVLHAFEDERVLLVYDFYYGEKKHEHSNKIQ